MRPVNLIPGDERRDRATMQGTLAYAVIGALLVVLAGVTLLVVTNNQISERKAKVARLQQQNAVAGARAARLAAYSEFGEVRDQRVAAVTSLADSRFDWERVMRELSLILPKDVWLTNLTGTANPEVQLESGGSVTLRSSIPGPALELVGCAAGQSAVAGFISALKDIDGVTRVGVQSSQLSETTEGGGEGAITDSASSAGSGECETHAAKFEIVVAFDAAPLPATLVAGGASTTAEATPAPEESSTIPSGG